MEQYKTQYRERQKLQNHEQTHPNQTDCFRAHVSTPVKVNYLTDRKNAGSGSTRTYPGISMVSGRSQTNFRLAVFGGGLCQNLSG